MSCENESQSESQVILKVNGRDIPLNAFASAMFTETVLGMLKPLHGVGDVQTVSLDIRCSNSS